MSNMSICGKTVYFARLQLSEVLLSQYASTASYPLVPVNIVMKIKTLWSNQSARQCLANIPMFALRAAGFSEILVNFSY